MSDQFYGDRFHMSDDAERAEEDTNRPAENSEANANQVPVDVVFIPETPVDEAVVGTMDENPVQEVSIVETAVDIVSPVYETIVLETPTGEAIPYTAPVSEAVTHQAPGAAVAGSPAALLSHEEAEHFRTQWNEIQGLFVDEPRAAVLQADALVSEVITQITRMFTNERSSLESQWNQGNDVSTEDLRKALQRYRAFFNRLMG